MISRYRFRKTRTEESQLQEEIQQCRQQRRLRASVVQLGAVKGDHTEITIACWI